MGIIRTVISCCNPVEYIDNIQISNIGILSLLKPIFKLKPSTLAATILQALLNPYTLFTRYQGLFMGVIFVTIADCVDVWCFKIIWEKYFDIKPHTQKQPSSIRMYIYIYIKYYLYHDILHTWNSRYVKPYQATNPSISTWLLAAILDITMDAAKKKYLAIYIIYIRQNAFHIEIHFMLWEKSIVLSASNFWVLKM